MKIQFMQTFLLYAPRNLRDTLIPTGLKGLTFAIYVMFVFGFCCKFIAYQIKTNRKVKYDMGEKNVTNLLFTSHLLDANVAHTITSPDTECNLPIEALAVVQL